MKGGSENFEEMIGHYFRKFLSIAQEHFHLFRDSNLMYLPDSSNNIDRVDRQTDRPSVVVDSLHGDSHHVQSYLDDAFFVVGDGRNKGLVCTNLEVDWVYLLMVGDIENMLDFGLDLMSDGGKYEGLEIVDQKYLAEIASL